VFGKTPVVVPAGDEHHVIAEVFSLNLGLLKDNYVGLEDIKHGLEGSFVSPWLISEGIANAVDIPSGDSNAHVWLLEASSPHCTQMTGSVETDMTGHSKNRLV
jgi:hypothetical protein